MLDILQNIEIEREREREVSIDEEMNENPLL